jgi:hypothetical protein
MKNVLVVLIVLLVTSPSLAGSRIDVGFNASLPLEVDDPALFQNTLYEPPTASFEVWGGYIGSVYSIKGGYKHQKILRNQGDLVVNSAHIEVGMMFK